MTERVGGSVRIVGLASCIALAPTTLAQPAADPAGVADAAAGAMADRVDCTTFEEPLTACTTEASGALGLTFTFTNHMTGDAGDPISVTNLWLDNAWLLDAAGKVATDAVTPSPTFYSFASDPVCSTADPMCADPSRTIAVTVCGALPGRVLRVALAAHDDDERSCRRTLEVPVPACDRRQALDERGGTEGVSNVDGSARLEGIASSADSAVRCERLEVAAETGPTAE